MGTAPTWVSVVNLADRWHIAPWEIAGGTPYEWAVRASTLDQARENIRKWREGVDAALRGSTQHGSR